MYFRLLPIEVMSSFGRFLRIIIALGSALLFTTAESSQPAVRVFAASSLTNALNDIAELYKNETGQSVVYSFAATSTLAHQLEAGAQADIFFSADMDWMDYLQAHQLIDASSRINLLGNSLVMICPIDAQIKIRIGQGFKLSTLLHNSRLAIADPASVPAGKYAYSALQALDLWSDVKNKLASAENVRGALNYVALGEASLGIVYKTDALLDKRVRIVYQFNEQTHPPIMYPIALTRTATKETKLFFAYLRSPAAQAVYKKYGFKSIVKE